MCENTSSVCVMFSPFLQHENKMQITDQPLVSIPQKLIPTVMTITHVNSGFRAYVTGNTGNIVPFHPVKLFLICHCILSFRTGYTKVRP